jgi:hypothetical protein
MKQVLKHSKMCIRSKEERLWTKAERVKGMVVEKKERMLIVPLTLVFTFELKISEEIIYDLSLKLVLTQLSKEEERHKVTRGLLHRHLSIL